MNQRFALSRNLIKFTWRFFLPATTGANLNYLNSDVSAKSSSRSGARHFSLSNSFERKYSNIKFNYDPKSFTFEEFFEFFSSRSRELVKKAESSPWIIKAEFTIFSHCEKWFLPYSRKSLLCVYDAQTFHVSAVARRRKNEEERTHRHTIKNNDCDTFESHDQHPKKI